MHITPTFLALLASASFTTALPGQNAPPKPPNPQDKLKDIIAALAGTYTLVNTSRSASLFIRLHNPNLPTTPSSTATFHITTFSLHPHLTPT
jgi:hypothetical protein